MIWFSRGILAGIILCLLMMMGACGASTNTTNTANGIDESQIARNAALRPNTQNVVAFHLEHPQQGNMEGDTDLVGKDAIPYEFDFSGSQEVEFCFTSTTPLVLNLINSQGQTFQTLQSSPNCAKLNIEGGVYTFQFVNPGEGDVVLSNFFIRRDPSSDLLRILINSDCQNCDLSGIEMEEIDFSGRDFGGSNFDNAHLQGSNFSGANLQGASFRGADLSHSIFDKNALGAQTIEKKWSSGDGSYTFHFYIQYGQQGQIPNIAVEIEPFARSRFPMSLSPDHSLEIEAPEMKGSLSLIPLHGTSEDAAVWAELCWGNGFANCFQGVMISFDSFDYYSNSLSVSLLRNDTFSNDAIDLNYVNESNSFNNISIVIFQKNLATSFDSSAVTWKVLENVGQGYNHPFVFPKTNYISANDSYGNYTPQMQAVPGQLYQVSLSESGDTLSYLGAATSLNEIQLINNLSEGSVGANIYKDGDLLAVNNYIPPQQKAVFEFNPTIWIGPLSQVEQGQVMDSFILSYVNTQFSLLGIASADIVMTGSGTSSSPFQFNLANVVMR